MSDYANVRAGLIKKGTNFNRWCRQNGVKRENARKALLGKWNGPKARKLREELKEAASNDPADPPPAMRIPLSRRLDFVRRFLAGGRSRAEADALAAEAGVHIATLYRWVADARERGEDAVAVAGVEPPVRFPPSALPAADLAAVVGWLLLDGRRTLKDGYRHLCEGMQTAVAQPPLSYVQFTRLVKGMTPAFADLRRLKEGGSVPVRLSNTPKILRRWSDLPAGHTYVGDQHLLDYQCVLPDTGEIVNLQLYVWMDAATTYWVGMAASYGPYTQYTVGLSLLDACRLHVPAALLNDNGRQERSAYVDDLWARLSGFIALSSDDRPHPQPLSRGERGADNRHYTTPHLPPVKPIEAQMSVLTKFLNQEGLTGYRKRDADPFENQQRQGALARAKQAGQLPTVDELLAALVRVMERHNTTPTRSEVDGEEYVPAERFHPQLAGRRIVLPDEDLKGLFYPRFQRKVRNACVRVKIGGKTLEFTHPALAHAAPDESVQVLINPLPPHSGGLALRRTGEDRWEPWCALEPWQGRGVAPYADPDTMEALMRQKQSYLNQFRDALKNLHAAARDRFAPETPAKPSATVVRLTEAVRLRGALADPESLADGSPAPTAPHEGGGEQEKPLVIDHQAALRALEEYRRKRAAEA